ncbi:galactose mutarotase-like protein, partial [Microthyrium microscopicum]
MVERANRPANVNISPVNRSAQPIVDVSDDKHTVSARLPTGETVEVLLFGATVTSWKNVDGSENLWLSEKAILDGSKPVRGGIPLVFPLFGPPAPGHATSNLPQHGFARNARWEYLGKSSSESAGAADSGIKLDFGLYSSALPDATKKAWPYDFGLVYSVTLSPDGLRTMLNVRNEGTQSFEFKVLFHTYFRVDDIGKAKITGLNGVSYVDKVLDAREATQSGDVGIEGEVDRVYAKIPQSTSSIVVGGTPRFDVVRDNLEDVVVWNPGKVKAAGMGDYAPAEGYINQLCVETGSVNEWQSLEAGESWEGGQVLKSL